jgi:hypothetical protein
MWFNPENAADPNKLTEWKAGLTLTDKGNGKASVAIANSVAEYSIYYVGALILSGNEISQYTYDAVMVIPKDVDDVRIVGDDLYFDYGDNTFRAVNSNETTGQIELDDWICGGSDLQPGTSDDFGKVVVSGGTKYAGPNTNSVYQKSGPDGLLGTYDDVLVKKTDPSKEIGPDNESPATNDIDPGPNASPTPNPTAAPINSPTPNPTATPIASATPTQSPTPLPTVTAVVPYAPSVVSVQISPANVSVIQKTYQQFTAQVIMSDGTQSDQGVTWEVANAQAANTMISEFGNLFVCGAESAPTLTVYAYSVENPSIRGEAIVTILPKVENPGIGIPSVAAAGIYQKVSIDGNNWVVLKKVTSGGEQYALLVSDDIMTPSFFQQNNAASNLYEGSAVQEALTGYFTSSGSTIRANAVIPNFASNDKSSVSTPTSELALVTNRTKDVFFSLSYMEAYTWPMQLWGSNYASWWLRTPGAASNQEYIARASTVSGVITPWDLSSSQNGSFGVRPAVWVIS